MESAQDVVGDVDLIAVTYSSPEFSEVLSTVPPDIEIFDLAGLISVSPHITKYRGIAW